MSQRKTCTDHCSACGGHFHGLGAFDQHLKRVNEGKNRWGAPVYQLDHSTEGLEVWIEEGVCELTKAKLVQPVVIWKRPMTEAQKRWLDLKRSDSHSSGEAFEAG